MDGKLPDHIGIIMDGNGRWAKKRGLPRASGHAEGAKAFRKVARHCKNLKIPFVTFFAFSTENWKRPNEEVKSIMKLFRQYLDEAEDYAKEKTRLVFLGDKSAFPQDIADRMAELEEKSAGNDEMTVMLAMNYGGRDDIVRASKKISEMVRDKFILTEEIDEGLFGSMLFTGNAPDVDLIIRPSGEMRLSNFLIWQSAYAEYYFTDTLWPDFGVKEFEAALEDYASRSRRYGNV